MKASAEYLSQTQRERLAFLELRAFFTGALQRSDIEVRFGVKPAAASRDLSAYRELAPKNLDYDVASRCYRPTPSFKELFASSSEGNPQEVVQQGLVVDGYVAALCRLNDVAEISVAQVSPFVERCDLSGVLATQAVLLR